VLVARPDIPGQQPVEEPVPCTKALTFDPAAAQAWLLSASDQFASLTRADSLGVDDELFGPGMEGFLPTIAGVLYQWPEGLHRRADVKDVLLWLIPDAEVLDQGALITVDLTNKVRLGTLYQDLKDFADRDQRGIPAMLSALAHIAHEVSLLLDTYHAANPEYRVPTEVSR
jgi:hypothetical protein